MIRRNFMRLAGAAGLAAGVRADVPDHLWAGYDFGPGPSAPDRLNQGLFGVEQDEGFQVIASSTPSPKHIRNFGAGLVPYAWEEGGPTVAVRSGKMPLEKAVEDLAALPFADVLYIRCDWRDVQSEPGRLSLGPVWKLTFDAARRHNLRVAFRIQLSSPNFQPKQLSLPDFLQKKVPMVKIGRSTGGRRPQDWDYVEPRYDHPEFQKAFREMNELLAAEYGDNPLVEWMDLMMYGFWGEAHTGNVPNPFPDYLTAEKTFVDMTRLQMDIWKKVPLACNTEPDISKVGNREVQDMCARAGEWFRSDSTVSIEEAQQVENLSHRPQWAAVVMEEGGNRHYDPAAVRLDAAGIPDRENGAMHVLDLNANYWALWTEAANLAAFYQKYPNAFDTLHREMGYRVRPSWVWQRKRYDTSEVILGLVNDGVAGVPGILRVYIESEDKKVSVGGALDAGQPFGRRNRQVSLILPKGMEGKKMNVRAEIETKNGVRRPITWTCAQPLNADGSFPITLRALDGRGWRKGI